jgi:EAL domain-containing protein (putative c-di-GMP-specific phosphodiesterase class I)
MPPAGGDGIAAAGALNGDASTPLDAALAIRDADILGMVRAALERRDVLLAFQPVVEAARPDRAAFHECLIRVIDDTGRLIPARDFVQACERHEIGRMIDCLALEMALETLAAVPALRLSVNMSARSIGYRPWREVLDRGLAGRPTVAERLIVEITESSAIVLPDVTQAFMEEVQGRGVAFALDDFGAGYTAFRSLRDLDFDILKIAGEFVTGAARSPDDRALVGAMVGLARHFDMFTVAEAVETAEDAASMRALGVDCLQGFHYGAATTRPPWLHAASDLRMSG